VIPPSPSPTIPPPPPPPPVSEAAPAPAAESDQEKEKEEKGEKEKEKEAPKSPIAITLGTDRKSIAPYKHGDGKYEEGKIDVTAEDNALKAVLTGGVGANVFLGFESSAAQSFQLVQEFEVTSTDTSVSSVTLTLESALVGFVRGKHRASACVKTASATVAPAGGGPCLSIAHPALCVSGPCGRCAGPYGVLNKDPLDPVTIPNLPLGRYVLTANFFIEATAGGLLDGHSTAIFSPEPKELDPWEREHDKFKGEDKEGYGFNLTLTADPTGTPPSLQAARTRFRRLAAERATRAKADRARR
jgi:hypothetical protein